MMVRPQQNPKNPYFEALDLVSSQSGALGDVVKLNSGVRIVVSHDEGAVCPGGGAGGGGGAGRRSGARLCQLVL